MINPIEWDLCGSLAKANYISNRIVPVFSSVYMDDFCYRYHQAYNSINTTQWEEKNDNVYDIV